MAGEDAGPAIVDALATAEEFAGAAGLSEASRRRLLVLVEELVCNVVRHGAGGSDVSFELSLSVVPEGVAIALLDSGIAFDPTEDREFSGPDAATGGGVGLALIRQWAESLVYVREDGRNRLALILPCDRPA